MKNNKGLIFEIVALLLVIISLVVIWIRVGNMGERAHVAFEKNKTALGKLYETPYYDSLGSELQGELYLARTESEFTYSASSNLYGVVTVTGMLSSILLGILIIRNILKLLNF